MRRRLGQRACDPPLSFDDSDRKSTCWTRSWPPICTLQWTTLLNSRMRLGLKLGHPDFGLYAAKQVQQGRPREAQVPERGVVEVKAAGDDAWLTAAGDQVSRYWGRYRLVLVTNTRDFVLVGEDAAGRPTKLETFRLADDAATFVRRLATPRAFAGSRWRGRDCSASWPSRGAHALAVCKTQNQTRDTTHGGARRKATTPSCPKRLFTTHADRLRPRLRGGRLPVAAPASRSLSPPPVNKPSQALCAASASRRPGG